MRLTKETIIQIVANYYQIEDELIFGERKWEDQVRPRHIAMYFCREYTALSLTAIAKIFNRTHATVINAMKSVNNQVETSGKYKFQFDEIENIIKHEIKNIENEKLIEEYTNFQENDCYDKEDKVIVLQAPNPFMKKEPGIEFNGYSGFREHSR